MRYRIAGKGWEEEFQVRRGPLGREWRVEDDSGTSHHFRVERVEESVLRITIGEKIHNLTLLPGNRPGAPLRFLLDDDYLELDVRDEFDLLDELLGGPAAAGGQNELRSVMPGIIRKVLVSEGDTVELDEPLFILEAMKMENEVRATAAGVIDRILVTEGKTVATGEGLAVIRAE